MAGNYRFEMDQKDIVRSLITTVGSFIQDGLIDKEKRTQQKEHCAERLGAEDGSNSGKDNDVRYSDQAVLANLDWGIDALEEAINKSNMETKMARLDHAEKMLQICSMLNLSQITAGVPNHYLSAWAHLNLSYLWKLRNNGHNAVIHILEMFIVDPFFARIDFAPELWKTLFLPHLISIVGWYSEERHRIVMDMIPDSNELSFTVDFDHYFNESLIYSVRPDQAEKMQELEQVYGQSLDENTRLFAKYYMDCMNYDSATTKKLIPVLPIVEPPMTPLHELSQMIPDYAKFGPILPKSARFSPVLRPQTSTTDETRSDIKGISSENPKKCALWDSKEGNDDDDEYDSKNDSYVQPINRSHTLSCSGGRENKSGEASPRTQITKIASQSQRPTSFTSMESPRSITLSSPKADAPFRREAASLLRLMSTRPKDSASLASKADYSSTYQGANMSPTYINNETTEYRKNSQKTVKKVHSTNDILDHRPPKDFVCPITDQIFSDPVTLETGHTYERKAIKEWIDRGNTSCPITRQPFSATELPKTNYVLKRLITSWTEHHPDLASEMSYASETPPRSSNRSSPSHRVMSAESTPSRMVNQASRRSMHSENEQKTRRFLRAAISSSPNSVLSQAAIETAINGLKPYVSCLCNSEHLQECEAAVLTIGRIWNDSKVDNGIHSYLSSPTIANSFAEILSASLNRDVLRTTIQILSQLIYTDDSIGEILTSVDSDFDCLATLLKNGLAEAAVLIYLLRPSFSQISVHDFVPSLSRIISSKNEDPDDAQFVIAPKDAASGLLEQIINGGDER